MDEWKGFLKGWSEIQLYFRRFIFLVDVFKYPYCYQLLSGIWVICFLLDIVGMIFCCSVLGCDDWRTCSWGLNHLTGSVTYVDSQCGIVGICWDIKWGKLGYPSWKETDHQRGGDFFRPKGCDENESTCGFYQRTWHKDAQGMIWVEDEKCLSLVSSL